MTSTKRSTASGESTRKRIIEAAREQFSEQGFVGASMSAIATRAGISVPGTYRHFESKGHLLLASLDEALDELRRVATDGDDATFSSRLTVYARPELQQIRRLVIEMHAAALRDEKVAALVADFNQRAAEELRSAVVTNGADGAEAEYRVQLLILLLMGMCHVDTLAPWLIGDDDFLAFVSDAIDRVVAPAPRAVKGPRRRLQAR